MEKQQKTRWSFCGCRPWLAAAALIAGLNILAYANTLQVPFTFDDYRWIADNPEVNIERLTVDRLLQIARPRLEQRRSLATLSLAVNYQLSGLSVRGYHLFNLGVHVLNALLLFVLLGRILRGYPQMRRPALAGLAAVLLWSLQPMHTQAVTYVIQRMTSMACTFYLLGILAYILARYSASPKTRRTLFVLTALLGLCGVLTKEIAGTLPLFLLLIEYVFFYTREEKGSRFYLIWLTAICLVLVVLGGLLLGPGLAREMEERYRELWFTMSERLLTQPRVVLYYLSLLLFPFLSRLRLEYHYEVSTSLLDPWTTLPAIIVTLALILLGLVLLFPRSGANARPARILAGFAITWYFGQLFMESSFYPLDMAFEHRLYLPAIAPLSLAAAYLFSGTRPKGRVVVLFSLAIIMLAFLTYQRNEVWRDSFRLARDTFRKSPGNFRTAARMGELYVEAGRYDKALPFYQWAVKQNPNDERMHFNLGLCLEQLGRYHEAREQFEQALAINEKVSRAHLDLANVYDQLGMDEEAFVHYQRAIELEPDFAMAHNNLGQWYSSRGRYAEAEREFQKSLEINPRHALALRNMGMLLIDTGRAEEAINYLRQAIEASPSSPDPVFVLGLALSRLGRYHEAGQAFHAACALKPDWALCWFNLGEVLRGSGAAEQARVAYQNALKIAGPEDPGLLVEIRERLALLEQQANPQREQPQ